MRLPRSVGFGPVSGPLSFAARSPAAGCPYSPGPPPSPADRHPEPVVDGAQLVPILLQRLQHPTSRIGVRRLDVVVAGGLHRPRPEPEGPRDLPHQLRRGPSSGLFGRRLHLPVDLRRALHTFPLAITKKLPRRFPSLRRAGHGAQPRRVRHGVRSHSAFCTRVALRGAVVGADGHMFTYAGRLRRTKVRDGIAEDVTGNVHTKLKKPE